MRRHRQLRQVLERRLRHTAPTRLPGQLTNGVLRGDQPSSEGLTTAAAVEHHRLPSDSSTIRRRRFNCATPPSNYT